jgi:hypothetical protein
MLALVMPCMLASIQTVPQRCLSVPRTRSSQQALNGLSEDNQKLGVTYTSTPLCLEPLLTALNTCPHPAIFRTRHHAPAKHATKHATAHAHRHGHTGH